MSEFNEFLIEGEHLILEAYKKAIAGNYKEAVSLGLSKFTFPSGVKAIPTEAFCDLEELEEIIQTGTNILIIKTGANITQDGSNLFIGA